jgi:hypothetical protein
MAQDKRNTDYIFGYGKVYEVQYTTIVTVRRMGEKILFKGIQKFLKVLNIIVIKCLTL